MGKLTAGMLLAVVVAFSLVGTAQAAKIPPTAQCAKTFTKVVEEWFESEMPDSKGANRKFARKLYEAGCISAVEPAARWMPSKPFSKKCVAAAKASDRFWSPLSRRLNRITKTFEARSKKIERRIKAVGKRLRKLKNRGASRKRIKRVAMRQVRLYMKAGVLAFELLDRSLRATEPKAAASTLTLIELASLRCIGEGDFDKFLVESTRTKQPVGRVLGKHKDLILFSALASLLGGLDESDGGSISANSSKALELLSPDTQLRVTSDLPGIAGIFSIRPE